MQGRKDIQPKMLYQVTLHDLVPADNYYRQLDKMLDLHFIYAATKQYYGSEGQESIDPVVFFKILLVAPFIYIDHMGPVKLSERDNFDVLPHPHIGLSTLPFCLKAALCIAIRWATKWK